MNDGPIIWRSDGGSGKGSNLDIKLNIRYPKRCCHAEFAVLHIDALLVAHSNHVEDRQTSGRIGAMQFLTIGTTKAATVMYPSLWRWLQLECATQVVDELHPDQLHHYSLVILAISLATLPAQLEWLRKH